MFTLLLLGFTEGCGVGRGATDGVGVVGNGGGDPTSIW